MATTASISDIKALIENGLFQQALAELTQFIQIYPNDPTGHSCMGITKDALGLPEDAHAAFRQAYHLMPSFPHLQNYVSCLARQGRIKDAQLVLGGAPLFATEHGDFAAFLEHCTQRFTSLGAEITLENTAAENGFDFAREVEEARLLVAAQEYSAAAGLLEQLTQRQDAPAALFVNLGMVLSRLDRNDDALGAMARAIALEPANPLHLDTLAKYHRKLGQVDAAEAALVQALVLDEASPERIMALGALYLSEGRYLEAADCFREGTRLAPEEGHSHQQLGRALHKMNRYDAALSAFQTALQYDPASAQVHFSMGVTHKKMGQMQEAAHCYQAAIDADPDMTDAVNALSNALRDLNNFEAAGALLKTALARWPDNAGLHNSQGVLEQQLGDKAAAVGSYRRAISLNRDLATAYHNLAMVQRVAADDPMVSVLAARSIDPALSPKDRINYNFALGKAMGDQGAYSESFSAIQQANRLRKTDLGYNIAGDRLLFDNIKAFFERPQLDAPAVQLDAEDKRPVFILGMPRSGTSLSEQIISAHADVHGCGELEFMTQAVNATSWQNPNGQSVDYQALRQTYLASIEGIGFHAPVFTDKMPLNFRWIGWILNAFPEAKIVHLVRNPMAVCWSNYQRYFRADGMSFTFDQQDIATYFNMYQDLMAFWHQTFPGRIFDFNYEELTENQETESRRLCDFLELSWDDRMLSFQHNTRAVKTASSAQVREEIYQGSSGQWRHYEAMLGPMLNTLNMPS